MLEQITRRKKKCINCKKEVTEVCDHLLKEGLQKKCSSCKEKSIFMLGTFCHQRGVDNPWDCCILEISQLEFRGSNLKGSIGNCIYCGQLHVSTMNPIEHIL